MNNLLNQHVSNIKGIGAEAVRKLEEISVHTVEDLINYFPYRYDDCRAIDINQAIHDERVTTTGFVQTMPVANFYGKKKSRLSFKLQSGQHLITINVFNQPYLKTKLQINQEIMVTGKWDRQRLTITASSVKFSVTQVEANAFDPVYHLKGELTMRSLRNWINEALKMTKGQIPETMPESLLTKYRLSPREQALRFLHFPQHERDVKQARRRFVYEEFLQFQLKMQALRKRTKEAGPGVSQQFDLERLEQMKKLLPFALTGDQQIALEEILADMKSEQAMNRLLQGDVGAGKTIVAALAILASISAGRQAAFMAPTEILAEQHYQSLQQLFEVEGIRVGLLSSGVKAKVRRELLAQLEQGELDLLIGTHALIQKDVVFANLGLVITDEQHRFGVEQRKILREKGNNPDVLFMTATPIPRTLAITVFGEMDVSIIKELPAGRKEIMTKWVKKDTLNKVLAFVLKEIDRGRQAYVICPLIEESEKMDFQNAVDVHAGLVQYFPNRVNLGLMHGRLTSEEKDEVMRAFANNQIQVLVSTTVVEVGVNVPNATCMLIYDAERFGISQLHQLRGRVGRGNEQSYCMLIADPKNEIAIERLTIMTETNDGFYLSERDLQLRGPGDFFGKKQSGVPEFKLADMVNEFHILEVARDDATALIESEAFWNAPEYDCLRQMLIDTGVLDGYNLS